MAKNSSGKTGGPARIRLVVLDAEVGDGDISALTQAVQNALRGPAIIQRTASSNAKAIAHQPAQDELEMSEADDEMDDDGDAETAPRPAKQRAVRKSPKAPDVVDIDMNGDVSFSSFASGKKADSAHKKYLIAAAWLHEHRNTPIITDGHIYTCFRSIGWPTNIADFGQPLRELKTRKFFTTPERGHYEINHIGLDYVNKLGGSDGAG